MTVIILGCPIGDCPSAVKIRIARSHRCRSIIVEIIQVIVFVERLVGWLLICWICVTVDLPMSSSITWRYGGLHHVRRVVINWHGVQSCSTRWGDRHIIGLYRRWFLLLLDYLSDRILSNSSRTSSRRSCTTVPSTAGTMSGCRSSLHHTPSFDSPGSHRFGGDLLWNAICRIIHAVTVWMTSILGAELNGVKRCSFVRFSARIMRCCWIEQITEMSPQRILIEPNLTNYRVANMNWFYICK